MTSMHIAYLYACLAALPIIMHVALAAGAPLGRFTVGGKFPEKLPNAWRGLALVQAALLIIIALVVLERAGIVKTILPQWFFWPVVVLTAMTCVANITTPSKPERYLWGPITLIMLLCALRLGVMI